jgi:hypothetical protein
MKKIDPKLRKRYSEANSHVSEIHGEFFEMVLAIMRTKMVRVSLDQEAQHKKYLDKLIATYDQLLKIHNWREQDLKAILKEIASHYQNKGIDLTELATPEAPFGIPPKSFEYKKQLETSKEEIKRFFTDRIKTVVSD